MMKIGFEEFVTQMCESIRSYLPEEYNGCRIMIRRQHTRDGNYLGMMLIRENEGGRHPAIEPCINLNSCYETYLKNGSLPNQLAAVSDVLKPETGRGRSTYSGFKVRVCGITGSAV